MSHLPARRLAVTRGAFTLVEMLIAMVLTLIMVAAIAEFYAYVGDTVRDGRAMMEISGQMRAAVQRLKSDFDQITCSVVPNGDDGGAQGYFEYFEGPGNDFDANANGHRDATNVEDFYPVNNTNGISDLEDLGVTNLLGDGDDYLAFTIRASGDPFSGRVQYSSPPQNRVNYSQLAEVVWWVSFEDLPGPPNGTPNGTWEFNEPRTIHRRQLLILPNYQEQISISPLVVYTSIDGNNTYTTVAQAKQRLFQLLQENDVSLSIRRDHVNNVYRIVHNSLQDLAKRENRFAHEPADIRPVSGILSDFTFPHRQLLLPSYGGNTQGVTPQTSFVLQATGGTAESPGEDIVLSNVLAFDVQVYDPNVRLLRNDPSNPQTVLLPSDPGYAVALFGANLNDVVGLGGYVDLGFNRYNKRPGDTNPVVEPNVISTAYPPPQFAPYYSGWTTPPLATPPAFSNATQVSNYIYGPDNNNAYDGLGCTYDTWTLAYERDGIFQLAGFSGVNANRMDLQTNGVDDDGQNGVDDYRERETVPPYPQPLRGLQVKIRMYEPGTRQMRQATVTTDFIAE